jgi:hypothetical protein
MLSRLTWGIAAEIAPEVLRWRVGLWGRLALSITTPFWADGDESFGIVTEIDSMEKEGKLMEVGLVTCLEIELLV